MGTGDAARAQDQERANAAQARLPGPTVPVYSVLVEGETYYICRSMVSARRRAAHHRGATIEITYAYDYPPCAQHCAHRTCREVCCWCGRPRHPDDFNHED